MRPPVRVTKIKKEGEELQGNGGEHDGEAGLGPQREKN